jgi:hypothetical protein
MRGHKSQRLSRFQEVKDYSDAGMKRGPKASKVANFFSSFSFMIRLFHDDANSMTFASPEPTLDDSLPLISVTASHGSDVKSTVISWNNRYKNCKGEGCEIIHLPFPQVIHSVLGSFKRSNRVYSFILQMFVVKHLIESCLQFVYSFIKKTS